jgi:predicted MPP superfamily phosphohydrolase
MLNFIITIISAIIIVIIGQMIVRLTIIPIQKQRELIMEIKTSLAFYADIHTQLVDDSKSYTEAKIEFRKFATELDGKTYIIVGYWLFEVMGLVLPRENIKNGHSALIGLSNRLSKFKDYETVEEDTEFIESNVNEMNKLVNEIKENLKI